MWGGWCLWEAPFVCCELSHSQQHVLVLLGKARPATAESKVFRESECIGKGKGGTGDGGRGTRTSMTRTRTSPVLFLVLYDRDCSIIKGRYNAGMDQPPNFQQDS